MHQQPRGIEQPFASKIDSRSRQRDGVSGRIVTSGASDIADRLFLRASGYGAARCAATCRCIHALNVFTSGRCAAPGATTSQ